MQAEQSAKLFHPALIPAWLGLGLLWLLHWFPFGVQVALGNALGWLLSRFPGQRYHIAATNLALCFPDTPKPVRDRWLKQNYQASMRVVLEHGMLWWSSEQRLRKLIRIDNPDAALGDGMRPVIWLAPHFVGLDMGGLRLAMDYPAASMYARARNPLSDRMMLRGRSRFIPPVLISKNDGIRPVIKALKQGLPFYYLPDQDLGRRNAVFAPFFGVAAATVSALPRIARLTGAQVIPVITRQLPGGQGYRVTFYPPMENFPSDDLNADITRMNALIEDRIREMPPQYLWLHRRFKTRPEGEASLYE